MWCKHSQLVASVLVMAACGCGSGGGAGADASAGNHAPVADAGPDQSVLVGARVTLDGSSSSDIDGDLLTVYWSFSATPAGSRAALSNAFAIQPTFTADLAGSYVLDLVVNDGTTDSDVDSVTITAATENAAPVASAGPDQNVTTGALVTLDGRASSDANGDPLAYRWSFSARPEESEAVLSNATSVQPTFVADRDGTYAISLVVNDGQIDSAPDTVAVIATPHNAAPVANAGPDRHVLTGVPVTLDGSASRDPDGDALTYQWSWASWPEGSAAVLSDATSVRASFTPDRDGIYWVRLIVSDGSAKSEPDMVIINATHNATPVADAGPDRHVLTGVPVTLDGSASHDPDGDALTYQWSWALWPQGSAAVLSNANSVRASFTPDRDGIYWLRLIVSDGSIESEPDLVIINATSAVSGTCAIRQSGLVPRDMALLPDDRIITLSGGRIFSGLHRYNSDTSGGENIATFTASADGIAVQDDGKIVVAGATMGSMYSPSRLLVQRFASDGTRDASFDTSGTVSLAGIGGRDVVVQPDGKLVVVASNAASVQLVRLLSSGALDTSFGAAGIAAYNTGTTTNDHALALQPDGQIIVVATRSSDIQILAFNSNGSLNSRFGVNGSLVYNGGAADTAGGVAAAPDGSFLVAGTTSIDGQDHILLLRYTASGSPDPLFGRDGAVVGDLGAAYDVVVQPDGRIAVAAETSPAGATYPIALVAKYTPNGSLDPWFASGGSYLFDGGDGVARARHLAVGRDGSIVAAGTTTVGTGDQLLLLKLYDICR